MNLSELKPPAGSHKTGRRVGRGSGSGRGKTAGKGHKGQMARSGIQHRAWKEGGQMPIYRRLPKRGFFNPARVEYEVVNLADLVEANVSDRIDIDGLRELRLVRSAANPVKILGTGTIDRALHVVAHAFSKSAEEKIVAAGGKCERLIPVAAEASSQKNAKSRATPAATDAAASQSEDAPQS